jgi:hypothetical protein
MRELLANPVEVTFLNYAARCKIKATAAAQPTIFVGAWRRSI